MYENAIEANALAVSWRCAAVAKFIVWKSCTVACGFSGNGAKKEQRLQIHAYTHTPIVVYYQKTCCATVSLRRWLLLLTMSQRTHTTVRRKFIYSLSQECKVEQFRFE